ncbi:DUF2029 domain-containing protein [Corynebacterium nasicanis]|uniref:DUF2029 domain-containing protein n=1 Tax=Corynebacterium nasicanis TaxID=1448267 RepID=A0ABW1Q8X4_9CORY
MHKVMSVPGVWLGWILSRLLLGRLIIAEPHPFGDVRYYLSGLVGPDPTAMTEYPDAGVWPLRLLGWLSTTDTTAFLSCFVVMCALIDAAFLALLVRHGGQRRFVAGWFWVFFGLATGHVLWLRLDLIPGVLVAGAAALLLTRPAVASAVLACAAAVKLWPAVLAATLVGGTWRRVGVFAATLLGLGALTWLTSGRERLLSPLTYQGDRGLQIESVAATPFLVAAHRDPEAYWRGYAASKSFEIHGPGTHVAVQVADAAMLIVLLFAAGWALRQLWVGRWQPHAAIALMLLLVLLLMVSNKVFSPQYIVWIGPLLAVCLTLGRSRLLTAMAVLTVLAAALGLYVYPFHYDPIWEDPAHAAVPIAMLALRNAVIVAITVLAALWLREVQARYSKNSGNGAVPPSRKVRTRGRNRSARVSATASL